jgi:glutamate/tyrosine decarboxylase-like PLP-dependent enzyme
MNKILNKDKSQIEKLLTLTKQTATRFFNTIDERATSCDVKIEINQVLNKQGLGTEASLAQFVEKFDQLIVSSSGPRYWGFVTGGATPAAIVGDWLAAVYDQNTQSVSGSGDVSALIELETIQLLLDLFGLPQSFSGGFVTGATMSNFTSLAVARQWLGKQQGLDIAKQGVANNLKILSATPHSSAIKCLSMLGMGSSNLIPVKTLAGNREAIDIADLKHQIALLKGLAFILISSAGTVNTVDFDNFVEIAKLRKDHDFWWHIDAAFGGFAACSPHYKHLLNDWDKADSITVDCHKWLNVPYESAVYFIKDEHSRLQVETFQNSNAPYLGDPIDNFNYLNFLPENSRRLRALPAWFTLTAYGKQGYQDIVESCVEMTQLLARFIDENEHFELLAAVHLNTVCFKLSDDKLDINQFLDQLNQSGKVFMTATIFAGQAASRAAFVNWRTQQSDVETATQEMLNFIR